MYCLLQALSRSTRRRLACRSRAVAWTVRWWPRATVACCTRSSGSAVKRASEPYIMAFQRYRIAPAVLRQATYGTIKFGIYYSLKKMFCPPEKESLPRNVACAVTAGVIGSSIANPTDVLKVRLQSGRGKTDQGLVDAFLSIYRMEGVQGLWKGVGQTAQRAGVVVGVELPLYDICKYYFLKYGQPNSPSTHFIAHRLKFWGVWVLWFHVYPLQKVLTELTGHSVVPERLEISSSTADVAAEAVNFCGHLPLQSHFAPCAASHPSGAAVLLCLAPMRCCSHAVLFLYLTFYFIKVFLLS
ncbi:hypothetical protein HAZT_HAZT004914 [Hyalella azteca]|uniref:Uncharacterized protein n=1 Tax=Hyalella azteca TaxID=294128 RepID=A0A6A0GWK9_HYAAZ|nr:hypothetical protein HAZT_HAZT004914 [Hyalella azteca]